ncbi:uncharacterized protein BJ171DRAFT_564624 [Polychytrium aggregatum]|uniref:uncharacterized protein n=1 Tax=Polychytrium aggregatum TaxID=110093 RepID=UPI0022FF066D|nr:uncharacterized protein BJ171DRAFT_564624 [Polychytrium aggregatum]KAI9209448.1 hypothetical protein BJ171DRAFT_564624 [Polychytrium aggregatum]
MSAPPDLRLVAEKLSAPPFNITCTPIALHDDVPTVQLVQIASNVMAYIDEANPHSMHRGVDLRKEPPEDTAYRFGEFLRLLKFKDAYDGELFSKYIVEGSRPCLLDILYFLLKDLATHKKRAYLAPYLAVVDVPPEYMQDEGKSRASREASLWQTPAGSVVDLVTQVESLQDQFKAVHKHVDGLRSSGNNAAIVKREIQQMEEEKQQVLSKIAKIRKKVEQVPNHEAWIQAAKNLRLEQKSEITISDKIKEQKSQIAIHEKKIQAMQQKLKEVQSLYSGAGADVIFGKMQEETKMNKYLATENLPKGIEETKKQIAEVVQLMSHSVVSETDMRPLEAEIKELNEQIAKLAEKRLLKNSNGEDKLALFRQQAAIISRKKEGTAQKLATLGEEINLLQTDLAKKREQAKGVQGAKILKGEEFKRYVSELRGKSMVYKRKKAELSEMTAEYGILQRTEELLKIRERPLQEALTALEKQSGVSGFHAAQETLEKVSERKSEIDEAKGKTLEEISNLIQKLTQTINVRITDEEAVHWCKEYANACSCRGEVKKACSRGFTPTRSRGSHIAHIPPRTRTQDKKSLLAPVIQQLRQLRQPVQDLEAEYHEKKRIYDSTMAGLTSETTQIEQEVKSYRQDIMNDQSREHYLNTMIEICEIAQERVMHEMKAYIGGDDSIEAQQKARGFKTYRDLYNKRIMEQENLGKSFREQQKEIKAKYEPNIKQLGMFADVKKLLLLKLAHNKRLLATGGQKDEIGGRRQEDRMC